MLANGSDDDDLGFDGVEDDDLGFGGMLPEDELPVIPGIHEESKSDPRLHNSKRKLTDLFGGSTGAANGPSEAMDVMMHRQLHDRKANDPGRERSELLEAEEVKVSAKQDDGFKAQPAKAKNTLRNLFVGRPDAAEEDPLLRGALACPFVVDEPLPGDLDFDLENAANQAGSPQANAAPIEGSSL